MVAIDDGLSVVLQDNFIYYFWFYFLGYVDVLSVAIQDKIFFFKGLHFFYIC